MRREILRDWRPGDTTVLPQPFLALTGLLLNSAPLPRLPGPAELLPSPLSLCGVERPVSCLTWVQFLPVSQPAAEAVTLLGGALLLLNLAMESPWPGWGRGGRGSRLSHSLHPQLGRWSLLPHPPGGGGGGWAHTHSRSRPPPSQKRGPLHSFCCKASHFPPSLTAIGTKPQKVRCLALRPVSSPLHPALPLLPQLFSPTLHPSPRRQIPGAAPDRGMTEVPRKGEWVAWG